MTAPLDQLPDRVQEHLEVFAAEQRRRLADAGAGTDLLIDSALASASGGKRLRAAWLIAGWLAGGGAPDDEHVVTAAAALEWLQASALVHDDLIDGSDTRRGRPAVHRAFATTHQDARWRGSPEAYGTGAAVLVGDLMLTWSDEMFRSCGLPSDRVAAALPYLDACRTEVVAGQFLDVQAQASGETSIEAAMAVVRLKSARYTVERPLHLGAVLAGGDQQLVDALSAVGLPLGEAFQLRDDVLGVFGDEAVTGKPAGDDLREGKRTVLLALAHDGAEPAGQAMLERWVGDPDLDQEQISALREVIVASGAPPRLESLIASLSAQAAEALADAPVPQAARETIAELSRRTVSRNS